jgi:flagellar hook assembly protein FlgD
VTVSSHTLSAAHPVKLGFSLSKPGMVHVKLMPTVNGKTTVVGTISITFTKAGTHTIKLTTRFAGHKVGNGSYTLSLQTGKGKQTSKAVKTKLTVR